MIGGVKKSKPDALIGSQRQSQAVAPQTLVGTGNVGCPNHPVAAMTRAVRSLAVQRGVPGRQTSES